MRRHGSNRIPGGNTYEFLLGLAGARLPGPAEPRCATPPSRASRTTSRLAGKAAEPELQIPSADCGVPAPRSSSGPAMQGQPGRTAPAPTPLCDCCNRAAVEAEVTKQWKQPAARPPGPQKAGPAAAPVPQRTSD